MMNLRETWVQKIVALSLIVLGYVSVFIEKDATAFIFMLWIGLPLFLTRENLYSEEG